MTHYYGEVNGVIQTSIGHRGEIFQLNSLPKELPIVRTPIMNKMTIAIRSFWQLTCYLKTLLSFSLFLTLMGTMNWEQVTTSKKATVVKVHQIIWLVMFQSVYRSPPPIEKPVFCLHIRGLSPTLFSKIEPSQSSLYLRIE